MSASLQSVQRKQRGKKTLALASMGKVLGEAKFAVLVCMPTRSKEDSGVDPLEDEYNDKEVDSGGLLLTTFTYFSGFGPEKLTF